MDLNRKNLRYYYWLLIEFTKKHSKMILLSFFLSFFVVVSLISFSPFLNRFIFTQKEITGMVGEYTLSSIPDEILSKISHGLVFVNEKGAVFPALASSWEIKDGGKEFRFHFKNDLLWDDGKEFFAKDLVYSFKDVEVDVKDKNTIYFKLKKALPIFPTYLTKPVIKYPLHGVVGLYKVDKIKTNQGVVRQLTLSPNKKGFPLLIYKFYSSESKLISAYKMGSINKMVLLKKNLADVFADWKNTKITRSVDYGRVMTLFLNLRNPLLSEKNVREAISLSIPTNKLVEAGEPANGPISPLSWAYNPELKQTVENLEIAEKNLKKYTEGTSSAKLNFETFYDFLSTASLIDENLRSIGLSTNLKLTNFDNPEQFDMLLAFWQIPNDPDQYFFWHSTQEQGNITNYKNVKVDKLLEDGRSSLLVSDRKNHYLQFQRVIVDDLPAIFLYHPYIYTIERK